MHNYGEIADWFMHNRQEQIGPEDVDRLLAGLPAGARVLDLGCGHGIPIARYLTTRQFRVYGIDNSAKLIAAFKENFPDAVAACEDISTSAFFETTFDAVIAYGVLFHLPEETQRQVLSKVAAVLNEDGLFLFTASAEMIDDTYEMAGMPMIYVSLGQERYTTLLQAAGLELLHAYPDKWDNYVYLFKRSGTRHQ